MSTNQPGRHVCPVCYSPFSLVRVLRFESLTMRLELCLLCGDYCRQTVRHDALIVSYEETIKTVKFRRNFDARTDYC